MKDNLFRRLKSKTNSNFNLPSEIEQIVCLDPSDEVWQSAKVEVKKKK